MTPETDPSDPALTALAGETRVAVGRLSRRLRQEKAEHELSDAQFGVLALLQREGPKTLGELADSERVRPPSMTRTVACLVDDGLAERLADPSDGRVTRIRPTAEGTALVLDVRRSRDAWLVARLRELSPDQRALLRDAAALLREVADR
ncbi:DNA-binding transcriptional regulator, MarR family [Rathayibacter oskolensis]|uniref:DNA-binding transcriptional regulator, MarR family n=1 Tax=Rathayibacter oskolensis TaxID=1891671 RepID=A0A1X7MZ26_9MICO|nr:MarR family transcriptional regulator [Rathayibacter oskolensis]SMH30169.1 DNA-binding transcriptional regulator, MarR family [Rathayibacter oskolensis]